MDNVTYTQLSGMIDANLRRSIEYGVFDCALWAADCLNIQIAIDLAADYRGQYSTLEEGNELLRARGYRDHVEVMEKCDWLEERPRSFARSGDIGVIETELGPATGPIMGHIIYPVTLMGMGIMRISKVSRVFGVKDD